MSPSGAPFRRSYAMHGAIAAGGMATVHVGRLLGPSGLLAARRDQAAAPAARGERGLRVDVPRRGAARGARRHPNVVPMLDVVSADGELLLVMEYVHGESLVAPAVARAEGRGARPDPDRRHGRSPTCSTGSTPRTRRRDERRRAARPRAPRRVAAERPRRRRRRRARHRLRDREGARAQRPSRATGSSRASSRTWRPSSSCGARSIGAIDVYAAGVVLWEALAGSASSRATTSRRSSARCSRSPCRRRAGSTTRSRRSSTRSWCARSTRDPDRRFPDARDDGARAGGVGDARPLVGGGRLGEDERGGVARGAAGEDRRDGAGHARRERRAGGPGDPRAVRVGVPARTPCRSPVAPREPGEPRSTRNGGAWEVGGPVGSPQEAAARSRAARRCSWPPAWRRRFDAPRPPGERHHGLRHGRAGAPGLERGRRDGAACDDGVAGGRHHAGPDAPRPPASPRRPWRRARPACDGARSSTPTSRSSSCARCG